MDAGALVAELVRLADARSFSGVVRVLSNMEDGAWEPLRLIDRLVET